MGVPIPMNHHLLTPATQAMMTKINRYTSATPQSLDSTISSPENTQVNIPYFTMEENRPRPFGRSLLIIQASTTM